jgi:hypothetical protein
MAAFAGKSMAPELFHYHLDDRQLEPLIPGGVICGLFVIIRKLVAAYFALLWIAIMDCIHLLCGQQRAFLALVAGLSTLFFSGFSFSGLFLCSGTI